MRQLHNDHASDTTIYFSVGKIALSMKIVNGHLKQIWQDIDSCLLNLNLRKSQITASSSTIDSHGLCYIITVLNDHTPLQRSVGKK